MKNQMKKEISRRRFLGTAAIGLAGMTVIPGLASSCAPKKPVAAGPKEIRLGFIGLGRQSMFLL
ncbi:MAG TPA: twin-arginine translocation signal domain-containing protein, partial [Prolixibacteraceae bacterium]|nr:twin-arginine translocation signal domain-containing protein [Prolixibacteraceae bacterium]